MLIVNCWAAATAAHTAQREHELILSMMLVSDAIDFFSR